MSLGYKYEGIRVCDRVAKQEIGEGLEIHEEVEGNLRENNREGERPEKEDE